MIFFVRFVIFECFFDGRFVFGIFYVSCMVVWVWVNECFIVSDLVLVDLYGFKS